MTPYHVRPMDLHRESEWCNHYDCSVVVMKHEYEALASLLRELIDIEGPRPGHVMWYRKVCAALGITPEGKSDA